MQDSLRAGLVQEKVSERAAVRAGTAAGGGGEQAGPGSALGAGCVRRVGRLI